MCIKKKSSSWFSIFSSSIGTDTIHHPFPYVILCIPTQVFSFENDWDSSDRGSVKYISIHNISSTSISDKWKSFHSFCRGFCYIYLIHIDKVYIRYFTHKSFPRKTVFLDRTDEKKSLKKDLSHTHIPRVIYPTCVLIKLFNQTDIIKV